MYNVIGSSEELTYRSKSRVKGSRHWSVPLENERTVLDADIIHVFVPRDHSSSHQKPLLFIAVRIKFSNHESKYVQAQNMSRPTDEQIETARHKYKSLLNWRYMLPCRRSSAQRQRR